MGIDQISTSFIARKLGTLVETALFDQGRVKMVQIMMMSYMYDHKTRIIKNIKNNSDRAYRYLHYK